jgi:effector-binding domain-containing protein
MLTIGEFSKVTRLSIKALRLYDGLELLAPEMVDPGTGYCYYGMAQAPKARAIALLRSLDMPLTKIKEVLTESDPDKVRVHLAHHRTVLEDRLEDHRRMLERVKHLIEMGGLMALQVGIKEMPAARVCGLTFEASVEDIGPESGRAYDRLYGALGRTGIDPVAPPRLVYLEMNGDSWGLEANVPIGPGDAPESDMTVHEMPATRAACALHRGPYTELGLAYAQVEKWVADNGYETAGPMFDIYVTDPAKTPDPADYETEICWPIR